MAARPGSEPPRRSVGVTFFTASDPGQGPRGPVSMESAPIGRWPPFRRFRRLSRAIAQKFALQDEMLHKPSFCKEWLRMRSKPLEIGALGRAEFW